NNSSLVAKFIQLLATRFSVKNLGSLHYFLGVEVLPTATGLVISQHKYIHDLLVNTKMDGEKVVSTPLSTFDSLVLHNGSSLTDAIPYRRLVGVLQYLSSLSIRAFSFRDSLASTQGTISFDLHLCCHHLIISMPFSMLTGLVIVMIASLRLAMLST
ncbi:hypothetical protein Prudu_001943, partial [Prunus dulcis]